MADELTMKINPIDLTVRDLVQGFEDNAENGVKAYGGKLDIRPPYQREFIYNPTQKEKVIETVMNGYPLNTMYWAERKDGTYEIIDGQQRTMSICQFVNNEFSYNFRTFAGLQDDEKEKILNYKLFVYVCSGNDSEKLKWFETINIAGEELTKQELRNAVYSGKWVTSAKSYFSKTNCAAYNIASKLLNGEMKRQAYLETAIKWAAKAKNDDGIKNYMAQHQTDNDAVELFNYFQNVITWVNSKFKYRSIMKGLPWGPIYDKYKDANLDKDALEEKISKLLEDSDIQKQSGIYEYVLDGDEHHLGIRAFDKNTVRTVYERQKGHCANPDCPQGKDHVFKIEEMEADHITPWSKGGHTVIDNCQMLCQECNRRKSNK